jgi:signal peptidase II
MNLINFKKIIISFLLILLIFILDRVSKLYILNLNETGELTNIYINEFLNLYLIWNKGIGFGLLSLETNFYYNLITLFIIVINVIILVMMIRSKDYKFYLLLMILGGSIGNLFDRIYYNAVPDFIDIHYNDFHWFIFNIADIFITLGVICLISVELFVNNDKEIKQ